MGGRKDPAEEEIRIKVKGEMVGIERRMIPLVLALNKVPAVTTTGSCGGHRHPTKYQERQGHFYVGFEVPESSEGWRALELIVCAVQEANEDNYLSGDDRSGFKLILWREENTLDGRGVMFELRGINVNPNDIADYIAGLLT